MPSTVNDERGWARFAHFKGQGRKRGALRSKFRWGGKKASSFRIVEAEDLFVTPKERRMPRKEEAVSRMSYELPEASANR